jgi:lipoprotein-anchoring transpeptidase ErfK/SrfK
MQKQTAYSRYRGASSPQPPPPRKSYRLLIAVIVVLLITLGYGVARLIFQDEPANVSAPAGTTQTRVAAATQTVVVEATQTTPTPAPGPCATGRGSQWIVVSISKRHLWACSAQTQLYDSPVITGIEYLAADLTPTGTYHIYAKVTDKTLNGSDSTGSWSDFVHYWMPFFDNQYGSYGFHDATWRKASDFGNIDPYSPNASHGCIEMPLAAAKWLYNWASVGTAVVIQT